MKGIESIRHLLEKINVIRKKYDEINKETGANYNIFNVLKLSSDEVILHSRFIGDMLNPKGKHGMGEVFLKLFIEQISNSINLKRDDSKKKEISIQTSKSRVIIEQYIGKKKIDEGGSIDLVITDGNQTVLIENKINARDQPQQLIRYKNKYPSGLLLYLTLFVREASDISTKKEDGKKLEINEDYFNITYEKDILKWLEKCLPLTYKYPLLRESLNQYLNIIKQLTGQSMNKKMDKDIKNEIISSEENYRAAQLISKELDNARSALLGLFRNQLQKRIEEHFNSKSIFKDIVLTSKYSSKTKTQFIFKSEADTNSIIFEISRMLIPKTSNSKVYFVNQKLYYGFRYNNKANKNKIEEISKLEKILSCDFSSNEWWLAKIILDNDFSNNYINLANKKTMEKRLEEYTSIMITHIEEFLSSNY